MKQRKGYSSKGNLYHRNRKPAGRRNRGTSSIRHFFALLFQNRWFRGGIALLLVLLLFGTLRSCMQYRYDGPDPKQGIFRTGGLTVDDRTKTVTVDGEAVTMTPKEFGIIRFLTEHAGQVFSIEQIYEAVWEEPAVNPENTVAVHIRHIREKIEINPKAPRYLKVVWGVGYKVEKIPE